MRVALVLPEGWPRDLRVVIGEMIVLPDDIRRWIDRTLGAGLPPGSRLEIHENRELATGNGWPLRIVAARILSAGSCTEHRLGAFYAFQEHGASSWVAFPDEAMLAAWREPIERAFISATPDFSGPIAALAQIADLLPAIARRPPPPSPTPAGGAEVPEDAAGTAALYNAALDLYRAGDFAGALTGWRGVLDIDPEDVLVLRKIAQAQHALGLHDEAVETLGRFRRSWAESADPRVTLLDEVVFDQFSAGSCRIFAYETLRFPDPAFRTLYTFRAVNAAGADLGARVLVETSDYARQRGTPFVLAVSERGRYRAVGAAPALPPYPELKKTVIELLREALGQPVQSTQ
jgi:hypothetical protein